MRRHLDCRHGLPVVELRFALEKVSHCFCFATAMGMQLALLIVGGAMVTALFLVAMVALISVGTGPRKKGDTSRTEKDWKRLGL